MYVCGSLIFYKSCYEFGKNEHNMVLNLVKQTTYA